MSRYWWAGTPRALDTSGLIEALSDLLIDTRDPLRVRHSLVSQLRTFILQQAMGWAGLRFF